MSSKSWISGFAVLAAAAVLTAAPAFGQTHAEEGYDHGGHAAAVTDLFLDNGKKWATDAPLREGMSRVRSAVLDAPADPQDAAAADLAQAVRDEVSFLIANCGLEGDADANLHIVIATMLSGSDMLENSQQREAGMETLATALHQYEEYFDDAQWQPLGAH